MILSTGGACVVTGGCAWLGGHAWLPRGMHGFLGVCMVGGIHGWQGACVVAKGAYMWLQGGMWGHVGDVCGC